MAEEPNPVALAQGHEGSEIPLGRIVLLVVSLGVVILLVAAMVGFLYYEMVVRSTTSGTAVAPVMDTRQEPPAPRLQDRPPQDLKQMREYEDGVLNSYGWSDRETGTVHIPISRAMELLAQRGLPSEVASLPPGRQANPSPPETSLGRQPNPANAPAMPKGGKAQP